MIVTTMSLRGSLGLWSAFKSAQAMPRGSSKSAPDTIMESRVEVPRWTLKGRNPSAGYMKVEGTSRTICTPEAKAKAAIPRVMRNKNFDLDFKNNSLERQFIQKYFHHQDTKAPRISFTPASTLLLFLAT